MNKYCNDNINNLINNIELDYESIENNKLDLLDIINSSKNILLIACGATYTVNVFCEKILNTYTKCNIKTILPRDLLFYNYSIFDTFIVFSYSGLTDDIIEACSLIPKDRLFIITKGKKMKYQKKLKYRKIMFTHIIMRKRN